MPPTAPPNPPMPITEATARCGNVSDARVKRFADHPWCPATARLINPTATHKLWTFGATTTGTTTSAATSIAVFRERFTVHPLLRSLAGNQPPATLPREAAL